MPFPSQLTFITLTQRIGMVMLVRAKLSGILKTFSTLLHLLKGLVILAAFCRAHIGSTSINLRFLLQFLDCFYCQ